MLQFICWLQKLRKQIGPIFEPITQLPSLACTFVMRIKKALKRHYYKSNSQFDLQMADFILTPFPSQT